MPGRRAACSTPVTRRLAAVMTERLGAQIEQVAPKAGEIRQLEQRHQLLRTHSVRLLAQPRQRLTGGGSALEKQLGRERCQSRSAAMTGLATSCAVLSVNTGESTIGDQVMLGAFESTRLNIWR